MPSDLIATDTQLAELLEKINAVDRVAVDTEADSLHSYREKLCLLQISVPAVAAIDDAGPDVQTGSGTRDQRSRLQFRQEANARVNDSAEHCAKSYQRNIPFQKGDQQKSDDRDTHGWPVNQRLRD